MKQILTILGSTGSIGNNTFNGVITTSSSTETRLASYAGTMTLGNAGVLGLGNVGSNFYNTVGYGNILINAAVAFGGTSNAINHSNTNNTLILTNTNNTFVGDIRNDNGFVRVSDNRQLGVSANLLRGSGGSFDLRTESPAGFAGRGVSNVDGSFTLFGDHAVGGALINQTITLGDFRQNNNQIQTFTGRNGYGFSFASTSNSMSGNANDALTFNANGTVTITGNIWSETDGTARTLNAVFSATEFRLVLSALQSQTQVKIVSNPTVVTLNNSEAVINVGQERPIPRYQYNQQTGNLEVNGFDFKPIGVILKVTPQVNAAGRIKLTVAPEVSQSINNVVFNGNQIPIIDTRKTATTVSLADGYTMGIGGLLTSSSSDGGNRVPFLGAIPGIGRLFRSENKRQEMTNLIIFITAKTLSADGAPVEKVFESERVRSMNLRREELPGHRDGSDPFVKTPAAKAPVAK